MKKSGMRGAKVPKSEKSGSALSAEAAELSRPEVLNKKVEKDKERRSVNDSSNGSVKIGSNTIGFHGLQQCMQIVKENGPLSSKGADQTSLMRSAVSVVKNPESGEQAARLPVGAVTVANSWPLDEVGKTSSSNETYFCLHYGTDFVDQYDQSRLDGGAHTSRERRVSGYVPFTCSVPPSLQGSQSQIIGSFTRISAGSTFDGARASPQHIPKSSRISAAQTKMSKEFGASVVQHLGHLKESHNFAGGAAVDLPTPVKESAHAKLVQEQQSDRSIEPTRRADPSL